MLFLVSLRTERRNRRKDKTIPRFGPCHGCATMVHRSELVPMGNGRLVCSDCLVLFWPPLDFSALTTDLLRFGGDMIRDLSVPETDESYLEGLVAPDLA